MSWCELKPTTYDANGNTLTDAQGRSFTWDFENRLTQAVNPGVGTTTFKYDPFGRRVQKSGPLGTTNYVYDTTDIVEELDGVGGVLASYAPGQSIDQPLAELRSGTTTYYHADGIGSITSLTNSSATTTASYAYDAFGNLSASTGSLANPFRYTAREFDSETGISYYRARYYDPKIGRFVTEDPLHFGGGDIDVYEYVHANPLNYMDPTGTTRFYGNWCGPDWTGGLVEEYNPADAGKYKPPIGPEDEVCKHHDICYFKCRSNHPCNRGDRKNCMKQCDEIFVHEMPTTKNGWWLESGIYLNHFDPDPGTNEHCGCKTKGK